MTDQKQFQVMLQLGLSQLGLSLSESYQKILFDFLLLLQRWNRVHSLTAIRNLERMLTHHVLDSLAIAPYLYGNRILDIGSGAGFPGIPLALLYPEKTFFLLDSHAKKTTFLHHVKASFNISHIHIIQARMETYVPSECMSSIVCRAVGAMSALIKQTEKILCVSGRWLLMKGRYPEDELIQVPYPFIVHRLHVPNLNAKRHLVEVIH